MSTSMDVTQMMWRPSLIKLTQIGNPDHSNGMPTPIYIDPTCIQHIRCGRGSFMRYEAVTHDIQGNERFHPSIECTYLNLHGHTDMLVLETPDEIARLRDEAFGIKSAKTGPKKL